MSDDPFAGFDVGTPAERAEEFGLFCLFFGGVFAFLWFAEAVAAAQ